MALTETGQLQNSIIVFASDNGAQVSQSVSQFLGKLWPWLRPWLWSWLWCLLYMLLAAHTYNLMLSDTLKRLT